MQDAKAIPRDTLDYEQSLFLFENPYGKWEWLQAWHTSGEWQNRDRRVALANERSIMDWIVQLQ